MMAVGPCPREMKVTAVAQPSAASTKNCQGWRPASVASGLSRTGLVEVSELIVDALVESGIDRRGRRVRGVGLPRPFHRDEADRHRAGRTDQIRKQPGQTVESLVQRRAEHLFAVVLGEERLDDLVVCL